MRATSRQNHSLNARLDALIGTLDQHYPAPQNSEYLELALAQAKQSYRSTNRALLGLESLLASLRH